MVKINHKTTALHPRLSSLLHLHHLIAMPPASKPARPFRAASLTSRTKRSPSVNVKPARSRLQLQESPKGKKPKALPEQPPSDSINQYSYFAGPDPITGWSVDLLANTLAEHQRGLFQQSGVLAEDMAANPWISDCLEVRGEFMTTAPFVVTPAGRGDARRCADFVREVLPDILPLTILRDLHRQYIMMGQSVAAIDWREYRDGKDRVWLPNIKPWQPQLTYYQQFADADSVDMGCLVATTLNRGLVRVDAGESRWLVISQSRLKPWLRGAVRTLGEAYLGDSYNFRDNMAFQDRFGRGIYLLRHPVSWKDEEIIFAAQSVRAGGGGGVLPCPTDARGNKLVDLDLVRADGTGFKTFDATDQRTRDRIFVTLLGQTMTSVGMSGGFAQARIHEHGLWRKFEGDAAAFSDAVLTVSEDESDGGGFRGVTRQWQPRDGVWRTQLLRWVSLWNFGSMDLAPYVWFNLTAPSDIIEERESLSKATEAYGKALQALGTAIEKLDESGTPYDLDFMMEQMGLKLKRPVE